VKFRVPHPLRFLQRVLVLNLKLSTRTLNPKPRAATKRICFNRKGLGCIKLPVREVKTEILNGLPQVQVAEIESRWTSELKRILP
jgi:hypothetical protein